MRRRHCNVILTSFAKFIVISSLNSLKDHSNVWVQLKGLFTQGKRGSESQKDQKTIRKDQRISDKHQIIFLSFSLRSVWTGLKHTFIICNSSWFKDNILRVLISNWAVLNIYFAVNYKIVVFFWLDNRIR